MRNLLFVALLFFGFVNGAFAQNPAYPYGLSFKTLFMDFQSQNGGNITSFKDYHYGFEIGFHKKINQNINLVVPFKYGNVNTIPHDGDNCLHMKVVGLDAQIQYQLYKPDTKLVSYFVAGLGGVQEIGGDFNVQAPLGFGLNFKAADNAFVNWQSEYRFSFAEDRNNLHHGIGFVYLFGNKEEMDKPEQEDDDTDGDGIKNDLDLCPEIPGPAEFNGCPDTDNDGVADFQDKCPEVAGLPVLKGCPDSDGDGVADMDDECPNVAGTTENKGCPESKSDRDGDGVIDSEDKCPDLAGDVSNGGCPSQDRDNDGVIDSEDMCPDQAGTEATRGCPDTDGDGIPDKDDKCKYQAGLAVYNGCPDTDGDGLDDSIDKCPNSPGPVASNGCPEISKEDKETLDVAMRAVQFDTGRATIKSESFSVLRQIANIMQRYPDYNLSISGHTDNVGSAPANQNLSEKRAKACYDYLATQGISTTRMNFAGYGESRPISDNNSLNGRMLNRRVEFTLIPR